MRSLIQSAFAVSISALFMFAACQTDNARKPNDHALQSWNDGAAKSTIIDFVSQVTDEGSPDYVPEKDRIAVFDNDGTLWSEQPYYFQLQFALDRVRTTAEDHPSWNTHHFLRLCLRMISKR